MTKNLQASHRYLEIQQYIASRYFNGIAPVFICNLITSYMFDQSDIPSMYILPLRSTTNTLMLEYSNILFNEFSLSEQFLISQLEALLHKKKVPKQLICIKSKKFKIDIDQTKTPAMTYLFSKQSTKHEMNSSIYFEMRSFLNTNKTYKILIFRKGKINIPGITTLYQLSEVQNIIDRLLTFYVDLTQIPQKPEIVTNKITMCNYVSKLNLADNQRLNLQLISNKVTQNAQIQDYINKVCASHQTRCMQVEFVPERVVMYVLFQLDKQTMPFLSFNSKSTSQRKKYRSIAITVTQKGFLLIQGANDDFQKTVAVLQAFQRIMNELIPSYLYDLQPIPNTKYSQQNPTFQQLKSQQITLNKKGS